jgi:hypothetical protein
LARTATGCGISVGYLVECQGKPADQRDIETNPMKSSVCVNAHSAPIPLFAGPLSNRQSRPVAAVLGL